MRQKQKIVYGITKTTWGGAQRYLYDLATNMPRHRYDITVIAGTPGVLEARLKQAGIPVIVIPAMRRDVRWIGDLWLIGTLVSILRNEKPDILHLSSSKMAGLGSLAGRLSRIPRIIVTVHGWPFREPRPCAARAVIWFFSWLTALLAHTVITITESDYHAARRMPLVAKNKIAFIPNGINVKTKLLPPLKARKTLRSILQMHHPENDLRSLKRATWLGAVGELTPNKDFETLFRSLKRAETKAPLVVIGEGEERSRLLRMIHALGLERQIFLAGFIDEAAGSVERLLPAFDILVMTSRKEGLPYVLLEAGFAKLPVVATHVGGIPDIVREGKTGMLVPPRSPEETAKALAELIKNPAVRKRTGLAARRRILAHFRLPDMVEKTKALYHA